MPGRRAPKRFNVYVIELRRAVLDSPRFRRANPQHDPRKPCVYVGMTGLTPEERYRRHKEGIQANAFVRDHGWRLRKTNYAWLNPMTYDEAVRMEVELARRLRRRGYAVWQH